MSVQDIDRPDPRTVEESQDQDGRAIFVASQWQLMWWRFRQHRLALISAIIVLLMYTVALLADFLAPSPTDAFQARYSYAPPQGLHLLDRSEGRLRIRPYVFGLQSKVDVETAQRMFTVDRDWIILLRLFPESEPYRMLGLFSATRRFIGPVNTGDPMFLLGADRLGRDVLSRLIHGTRLSMSIGLVGMTFTFTLGIVLGGISGYYGGWVDDLIQRLIEFIRSMPAIPLWLGLAAAMPRTWSPARVYFAITIILSLRAWVGLGRVVRGRFLSLRQEEFVLAARLEGSSEMRIILRHMVPSMLSHIIASLTLSIPGMILQETALSFLGLGLRPPAVSWGVMLQEAQNIRAVALTPWLMSPAAMIIIAVIALNFVGDGLRDAADPYKF